MNVMWLLQVFFSLFRVSSDEISLSSSASRDVNVSIQDCVTQSSESMSYPPVQNLPLERELSSLTLKRDKLSDEVKQLTQSRHDELIKISEISAEILSLLTSIHHENDNPENKVRQPPLRALQLGVEALTTAFSEATANLTSASKQISMCELKLKITKNEQESALLKNEHCLLQSELAQETYSDEILKLQSDVIMLRNHLLMAQDASQSCHYVTTGDENKSNVLRNRTRNYLSLPHDQKAFVSLGEGYSSLFAWVITFENIASQFYNYAFAGELYYITAVNASLSLWTSGIRPIYDERIEPFYYEIMAPFFASTIEPRLKIVQAAVIDWYREHAEDAVEEYVLPVFDVILGRIYDIFYFVMYFNTSADNYDSIVGGIITCTETVVDILTRSSEIISQLASFNGQMSENTVDLLISATIYTGLTVTIIGLLFWLRRLFFGLGAAILMIVMSPIWLLLLILTAIRRLMFRPQKKKKISTTKKQKLHQAVDRGAECDMETDPCAADN